MIILLLRLISKMKELNLIRNELPAREKYLFIEQRPEIKDGESFDLEIKTIPNEQLNVGINGIQNFKNYNIYLFDERLKNLYNLQSENNLKLNLAHQYNNFKLFIGTNEYHRQNKTRIRFTGLSIIPKLSKPI